MARTATSKNLLRHMNNVPVLLRFLKIKESKGLTIPCRPGLEWHSILYFFGKKKQPETAF